MVEGKLQIDREVIHVTVGFSKLLFALEDATQFFKIYKEKKQIVRQPFNKQVYTSHYRHNQE